MQTHICAEVHRGKLHRKWTLWCLCGQSSVHRFSCCSGWKFVTFCCRRLQTKPILWCVFVFRGCIWLLPAVDLGEHRAASAFRTRTIRAAASVCTEWCILKITDLWFHILLLSASSSPLSRTFRSPAEGWKPPRCVGLNNLLWFILNKIKHFCRSSRLQDLHRSVNDQVLWCLQNWIRPHVVVQEAEPDKSGMFISRDGG